MKLKVFPVGPLGTNCYFIIDEKSNTAAVVDPGYDAELIAERLKRLGLVCKLILLTHGHADHTGALEGLRKLAGAPVYIHADDAEMLADPMLSQAKFVGAGEEPIAPAERLLADGDIIEIGYVKIEVLHTPGHTPGSVCYLIRDARVMLSGDTLFREDIGRYDLEGGDYGALMKSLGMLAKLEGDWQVFPGHGPPTTLSHERKYNMYLSG
ncbi:MAG TPA: MBL fold metallo-hydrolase [Bacillota bacterium]|nr:MBL fold metallo-hydrolase [Clostridiales bacterium]HPT85573.1 MBL fold metallo-hydrolase [Bacillota bacterium]